MTGQLNYYNRMIKMHKLKHEIWAIIPCKKLEFSNGRLIDVLSFSERRQLACFMLEDVLTALAHSTKLAGVLVASDDPVIKSIAAGFGARCLQNYADKGLSSALTSASLLLAEEGAKGVIAIHSDVPLMTTNDIKPVITSIEKSPAVTVVPADRDLGTNLLAMSPPGIIEYSYGKKSSLRHAMAARAIGIEPTLIHASRLGLDLDTPEDLERFLSSPSDTKTFRYLTESGVRDRLLNQGAVGLRVKAVG